jgi:hypothetical protein
MLWFPSPGSPKNHNIWYRKNLQLEADTEANGAYPMV